MKDLRNIGLLCSAFMISAAFISQTNAEIIGMGVNKYPPSESLKFNNLVCEVKNVYRFSDDSSLKKLSDGNSLYYKFMEMLGISEKNSYGKLIDEKFIIDRKTGKYKFKEFGNEFYENTVIDVGSKEQSYKVISKSSGGYIHTQYVQVDVFQNNGDMNFRIMDSEVLLTGFCQLG